MNETTQDLFLPYAQDLAADWLASGATTVSLWNGGNLLMGWPEGAMFPPDALVSPIQIGRYKLGELRVTGMNCRAQAHLDTAARLLAQTIRLNDELDQMTSDLIEAQDQILALYDLTQSTRSHLGIHETLCSIASEATRLLRVEGTVLVLPPTLVHDPMPLIDELTVLNSFRSIEADGCEIMIDTDAGFANQSSLKNACFLPIRLRGSTQAMLGLINKSGGAFTAPDLKLARTIAEHAGAQLEHAILYQEMLAQARHQTEMQIARDVQTRLLPQKLPKGYGLDIFAHSRPASHVGVIFMM